MYHPVLVASLLCVLAPRIFYYLIYKDVAENRFSFYQKPLLHLYFYTYSTSSQPKERNVIPRLHYILVLNPKNPKNPSRAFLRSKGYVLYVLLYTRAGYREGHSITTLFQSTRDAKYRLMQGVVL